jgi:hypothetical protein
MFKCPVNTKIILRNVSEGFLTVYFKQNKNNVKRWPFPGRKCRKMVPENDEYKIHTFHRKSAIIEVHRGWHKKIVDKRFMM